MPGFDDQHWVRARDAMVDAIESDSRVHGDPWLSRRATDALRAVPRERFVPASRRGDAYLNEPLPIGHGQTISQPLMVAWLVDAVGAGPGRRILEVGTGCGYQAAVLAASGAEVWSIEIRPALARRARRTLDALGWKAVRTRVGDGAKGWPEHAPFDGIVLTAAPAAVPEGLFGQLSATGRLVAPVGPADRIQRLMSFSRRPGEAEWVATDLGGVRFVPLVGGLAARE